LQIKIKKLNINASVPERATEFAGGWDVRTTEIEKISSDLVICKLGFALSLRQLNEKAHRL
jgi:dUTPase